MLSLRDRQVAVHAVLHVCADRAEVVVAAGLAERHPQSGVPARLDECRRLLQLLDCEVMS